MTRSATSYWDEPGKLDQLIALRNEALSCGVIGRKMGKTRNSIIAKLNRINLPSLFRGAHSQPRDNYFSRPLKPKPLHKPPSQIHRWPVALKPKPEAYLPPTNALGHSRPVSGEGKLLVELADAECRFATGYDKHGSHLFCGAATDGSSWCAAHHARCSYEN